MHRVSSVRIAIAYDRAFCFYYEDNLDLLKDAGAEIIKFSPLYDQAIPEADAIYIGGGYPELYAKELSKNTSMLQSINDWADSGKPMYAECGGLMYLSRGIHDLSGRFYRMAGVLPFEAEMKKNRASLGYREIQLKEDCILGKKGNKLRGHEFHYSEIINSAEEQKNGRAEVQKSRRTEVKDFRASEPPSLRASELIMVYSLKNNMGERLPNEGYRYKNTLASYIHIHFGSNPDIAKSFIRFIKECHSIASWNPVPYCHSQQNEESLDSCFRRNDEKKKSIDEKQKSIKEC
jgi:cobyrinic acid a,c-diamide synthase